MELIVKKVYSLKSLKKKLFGIFYKIVYNLLTDTYVLCTQFTDLLRHTLKSLSIKSSDIKHLNLSNFNFMFVDNNVYEILYESFI